VSTQSKTETNALLPPPAIYAHVKWDEGSHLLRYEYHGRTIVTIRIPEGKKFNFRAGSDGLIQSAPLVQQTFLSLETDPVASATATFFLNEQSVVMRPRRAGREEAIVGSVGSSLVYGVNGLYDKQLDLLLDWHGRPWHWLDGRLKALGNGLFSAMLEVELSEIPWILNLRPRYYQQHLGYRHHRPWIRMPNQKAVAGWCSWEAYRRDVSEERILKTAGFLGKHFRDYGLEYVQLDDGFQQLPLTIGPKRTLADAWLVPNKEFPSGLKHLADTIKKLGMQPGIWMSADIETIQPSSNGSTCQFMDNDGSPLKAFWMRAVLDCKPQTIARQIKPLYEGIRKLGFTYVKCDQIRHLLADALQEAVRRGLLAEEEAVERFREYMKASREGLGADIYYLASWGVLTETIGCADACRISQDANPQWSAIRMQIIESARWFHSHRILFLNDPDHVCVRTKAEWAASLLSLVSLSGQLFMLSDQIDDYDAQRVRLVQKCLPPLTTSPAETGPVDMHYPAFTWLKQHGAQFQGRLEKTWCEVSDDEARIIAGYHETMDADHPLGSLWAFHLSTSVGQWCVAMRIGTLPLRQSTLSVRHLGLDPAKTYLAFDFWAQKFLGEVRETMKAHSLAVGHCQVIAFREKLDHPQFLACSRHVSMGAVGIQSQHWCGNTLTLNVEGVTGSTETYWIHTSDGRKCISAHIDNAPASPVLSGNCEVAAIAVTFSKPAVVLTLVF